MAKKHKRSKVDKGQIIGAIIFISLFIGLILLGLFYESGSQFDSSFFDDLGRVMQGQYD